MKTLAFTLLALAQDPPESPALRLENFRGGDMCYAGRGRIIAVKTAVDPAGVRVDWSADGGTTWREVPRENLTAVNGGFLWKVPQQTGGRNRLRVWHKDLLGRRIVDASDKDFEIRSGPGAPPPGPVTFTTWFPDAFKGGATVPLAWESRGTSAKVDVYLRVGGKKEPIAKEQPATGGLEWRVPEADYVECTIVLEAEGRSVTSPKFAIDIRPPEFKDVEIEVPK